MTEGEAPKEISRQELYQLVWSLPMIKVAERFRVSGSYMARVCSELNVPRPPRGYWARLAVGKAGTAPPLPAAVPGDPDMWTPGSTLLQARTPEQRVTTRKTPRETTTDRRRTGGTSPHPLVRGVEPLFLAGRRSREIGLLNPYKKLLLDLHVTESTLGKALHWADKLFKELERNGHRVVLDRSGERPRHDEIDLREKPLKRGLVGENIWMPQVATLTYVHDVPIGLGIYEMVEEVPVRYLNGKYVREDEMASLRATRLQLQRSWTTTRWFPTGRLCLVAYSSYYKGKWQHEWREAKGSQLNVKAVVDDLVKLAPGVRAKRETWKAEAEEERRRRDEQTRRWREEQAREHREKAIRESKLELTQIAERWNESRRYEEFFDALSASISTRAPEEQAALSERLEHARSLFSFDLLHAFKNWHTGEGSVSASKSEN